MVLPAVKEQILTDLDRLSPQQQRRAAELVHALVKPLPPGASFENLAALSGILDDASAQEMTEAIEEGCGRIDSDGPGTPTSSRKGACRAALP